MLDCELTTAASSHGGIVKPGTGSFCAIRKAIPLIIIGVCVLGSACRSDVQTTWSAEARSQDGNWLASARTEEHSGFGTAGVETDVYLKWLNSSKPPQLIVVFFPQSAEINLAMKWATRSHLDVTYNGRARVDLQVVKCGDVDISLRDLSRETDNAAH